MSNKELYQRSFDKLHPSEIFEKELQNMMENQGNKPRKLRARKIVALAAAVVVVLSLAVAASASGFAQTVRMWINGQEVDATQYTDADGNIVCEVDGENGEAHVFIADDPNSGEALAQEDIQMEYVYENGKDLLRFTQESTGLVEDVDITGQMRDGCFDGTVDLEKFNATAQVSLTADGSMTYTIDRP